MTAVRGSLDIVSSLGAMGWAYDPEARQKMTVQALLNHAVIGEVVADIHRPDLAAVGMGDGNCGFNISFYQPIDPLYLPFVVVKPEGSDLDLPRGTISGYNEFFSVLYRKFPVTSRTRSVFGGLWTDRIDAVPLMHDRIGIGMIPAAMGDVVSDFIRTGFAIIEGSPSQPEEAKPTPSGRRGGNTVGTAQRAKTPDLAEAAQAILRVGPVVDMMKLILEGLPLALSVHVIEGFEEGFRQASAMEVVSSPAECVTLVTSLDDKAVELDVIRESHLFPEFSSAGESRWTTPSSGAAIDVALRQHGMIDNHRVHPGNVAIIGPGLIHRVRTEPGTMALRMHCTPSRIAPFDRILDGSRKEFVLESGARIWI